MIKDTEMFCNQEFACQNDLNMPGWIKTGIRLCSRQSDACLCCKHPGELVIFHVYIRCY